jgi:hypothetical protein
MRQQTGNGTVSTRGRRLEPVTTDRRRCSAEYTAGQFVASPAYKCLCHKCRGRSSAAVVLMCKQGSADDAG